MRAHHQLLVANIYTDLADTQSYLLGSAALLVERGHTLEACQARAEELRHHSEGAVRAAFGSGRVGDARYWWHRTALPTTRRWWRTLTRVFWSALWREPCRVWMAEPEPLYMQVTTV